MMTPRERVLTALGRKRTDRAPADFQAWASVTERLIARLGVKDHEELLQALGVDMRRAWVNYYLPASLPDADGYVRDMWGARKRPEPRADGTPNWISPFHEDTTVDDVHAHAWPDPAALDFSEPIRQFTAWHGTYATYGAPWCPFFHEAGWLIDQETFYVWMGTKPDVVEAIVNHMVDYEVEATRRFFEEANGCVDIAYFGNDFGTQRGLFVSPAMHERFLRRPLKRFFDVSRSFGCRVMQHSCGAVRGLIPSFIEDGVDILDPIQVRAEGMALDGLVRDFGSRLVFHGGVDTQETLPFGSPADVREQVRGYRTLTRERGGYLLCGSQELIDDIPLDNILAMYDENRKG
jgi:uroporphyrinogen decarboxylase